MADPIFPEAVIGPVAYISIGILISAVIFLIIYIYKTRPEEKQDLNLKQLNMPKSRMTVLEKVIEEGSIQSNLPEDTGLSKATVSQAIKDLKKENLITRKKRGNSYLIEPDMENIEEKFERK